MEKGDTVAAKLQAGLDVTVVHLLVTGGLDGRTLTSLISVGNKLRGQWPN